MGESEQIGFNRREFLRSQIDPEVAKPSHQYTTPTVFPIDAEFTVEPGCGFTTTNTSCNYAGIIGGTSAAVWWTGETKWGGGSGLFGGGSPAQPYACGESPNQYSCWPPDLQSFLDGWDGDANGARAAWDPQISVTTCAGGEEVWNTRGTVDHWWNTGMIWGCSVAAGTGVVIGQVNGKVYAHTSITGWAYIGFVPASAGVPPWPYHDDLNNAPCADPFTYPYGDPIYNTVRIWEVPEGDAEWIFVEDIEDAAAGVVGGCDPLYAESASQMSSHKRDDSSFWMYTKVASGAPEIYGGNNRGIWLFDGSSSKVASVSETVGWIATDTDLSAWYTDTADKVGLSDYSVLYNTGGGSYSPPDGTVWDSFTIYHPNRGVLASTTGGKVYHLVDGTATETNCTDSWGPSMFPVPGGSSEFANNQSWTAEWALAPDSEAGTYQDYTGEPFATVEIENTSTFQLWVQVEADMVGFGYPTKMPSPYVVFNRMEPIYDDDPDSDTYGLIIEFAPKENWRGSDYMFRVEPNTDNDPVYVVSNEYESTGFRTYETMVRTEGTGYDATNERDVTVLTDVYEADITVEPGWYQITATAGFRETAGTVRIRGFGILQGEDNDSVSWGPAQLMIEDGGTAISDGGVGEIPAVFSSGAWY